MYKKNCFDFLRFFFAAIVLFGHLLSLSESSSLHFLSYFGYSLFALKGFFVISGFLVTKSYLNTSSIKNYYIKRAKRIFPAYVFIIIISTIFLSLISSYNFLDYFTNTITYKYFGWNLIFMNFMQPCLPGVFVNNVMCAVNGALWTLKVEEGFYIVLPIILYFIKKFKKPVFTLISLYILSFLYWHVMAFYFNKPELAKQLPGYLSYFSSGIFIFLYFEYFSKYKFQILAIALFIIIISGIFSSYHNLLYPISLASIIIFIAYNLPFLNNFGKYGDFTYGLYIYHFPIIQIFRNFNLFEKYNPYLMGICVLIITFVCAVFSWFVIEKRFLERYKKRKKV